MSKIILVTGATGNQGGALVDALLARSESYTILAVTRDANSSSAKKLASKSPSIKIVQGTQDDAPALFASALETASPIWGVYSVQVSLGKGVTHEGEIKQGKAMVDESLEHGVKHFVYSSVDRGGDEMSWNVETPIPHFQSKYLIERYLREQAGNTMGWKILRPTAFMDNWEPGFPARVFMAALSNNLGEKPLQWIAASDIGVFAAIAFADPEGYNHKAIGLAGDNLNVAGVSQAFQKGAGASVTPTFGILGSALTTFVPEMGMMVRWFRTDGYGADIEKLRKIHPGLKDFETWTKTSAFKK